MNITRNNEYNKLSVSDFSKQLHVHLDSCTKAAMLKMSGVNKESCHVVFYKMMADGVPDLAALSGDHPVMVWLCTNVLVELWTFAPLTEPNSAPAVVAITPREALVARYICGFVCCTLEHRNDFPDYGEVLQALKVMNSKKH